MLQADGLAVRVAGIAILREIASNKQHRYRNEAFAVLASFCRARSQDNEKAAVKSQADFIDAFSAIASREVPKSIHVGDITLRGCGIGDLKLNDYDFMQCKFIECSIYSASISSLSGAEFNNCSVGYSSVRFHELMISSFDNCEFEYCAFSGPTGSKTFRACSFKEISADSEFKFDQDLVELRDAIVRGRQ
ncbi:hypothetical protein MMB17_22240 [Methylobacterium organophilum]|uniref:hypothetical protein n=1 Tax=Methylobacterium organophilum TaxID=410 RepID=UPI001F131D5D|nr:hypothetical protein [Methylobacterium organophilum]UMY17315.1 hypothetical protein MMB17_22240 [Methylobacterium organophilum]